MIAAAILAPLASALLALPFSARTVRMLVRLVASAACVGFVLAATPQLDRLSELFALLVAFVGLLATVFSTSIFPQSEDRTLRWTSRPAYFLLLGAFLSSMLLAVTSTTFTGLWIGISATTLATTFLVGFTGGKAALEAAWKYLVLCSVGIAIALLGLLLLARAATSSGVLPSEALSWNALVAAAPHLSTPLTSIALLLMLLGFGTKAGLAPMHTWLPDAHSKAPAPVSALLSGLLVSCALYAILRVQAVAQSSLAHSLSSALLVLGCLSVLAAAILMLVQRDVKRFLSYSTIEHAGIIAIALGTATPLGILAALYHVFNHALLKSAAFLSTGLVAHEHGSVHVRDLGGLLRERSGAPFLTSLAGLAGLPPLPTFFSELLVIFALVQTRAWVVLALLLIALIIAFTAIARVAIRTVCGTAPRATKVPPRSALAVTYGALAVAVALSAIPFVLKSLP